MWKELVILSALIILTICDVKQEVGSCQDMDSACEEKFSDEEGVMQNRDYVAHRCMRSCDKCLGWGPWRVLKKCVDHYLGFERAKEIRVRECVVKNYQQMSSKCHGPAVEARVCSEWESWAEMYDEEEAKNLTLWAEGLHKFVSQIKDSTTKTIGQLNEWQGGSYSHYKALSDDIISSKLSGREKHTHNEHGSRLMFMHTGGQITWDQFRSLYKYGSVIGTFENNVAKTQYRYKDLHFIWHDVRRVHLRVYNMTSLQQGAWLTFALPPPLVLSLNFKAKENDN